MNTQRNSISELQNKLDGEKKFVLDLQKDQEKYELTQKNLQEEQQIFIGQLVKKGIEDKSTNAKIATLKQEISSSKQTVHQF